MTTFGLTTLGQFAFTCEGRALPSPPTKKARALLAYLVMNRAADVSREQLLERFWPDFDPERARDNLKVTLWSVRRSIRSAQLAPDVVIRADRSVIRWIAPVAFDVDRFTELAAKHFESAALSDALSLYRGNFLEGDFDEWTTGQRERLAALYAKLLSRAASASKDVAASEQLIGRNPYDESAYATLVDAELAAGRPRAAALFVERCRSALSEVGAKPSADFERRFGLVRRPVIETCSELRLPFVARDPELGVLSQRFDEALGGRGSVSIVHGDAGIGKSSLLHQAATMASQRGLHVVELRCKERETQTLGEWQTLFEGLTRKRLSDVVATAGFETTRTVARSIADALRAPSVIVVDDAQYLSGESFVLLGDLIAAGSTQCFVIGVRPEGVARLRTLLHGRTIPAELRLDCLSDRDVESALRQAAGTELSDLARVLFERTKGHPLYVVEVLAALVESGALLREERGWRLRASLDESLPLPATLRSFIEGRLTARGSVPAMVASALSLETAASASELRVALNMDEAQLLDALDDLLALGLIVQPESGAQFAFSHDLVQEVATAMLNSGRRVRLHAEFALCLQASRDRDASMRQARHLRAASEPLAAGAAYLRAARQAHEENAARDAGDRAREGIGVVERLERSRERDALLAELSRELALARLTTRDIEASAEAANEAVALARSVQDGGELGESLVARAVISGWMGLPADQLVDAKEAATAAERFGEPGLRARALVEAAMAARTSAQRDAALQLAREAYETAKDVAQWGVAQRASAEIILTCCTWWNFQEAQRWVPLGNEAAWRGSSVAQAAHFDACAALWYLLERYDDAEHDLQLAAGLIAQSQKASGLDTSRYPLPLLAFFNRYLFGTLAIARERWDEALVVIDDLDRQPATLPIQADALATLQVQALLWRGAPVDVEKAQAICLALRPRRVFQSVLGFSSCIELSRTCVLAVIFRRLLTAAEAQTNEAAQRLVCIVPGGLDDNERASCMQAALLAGAPDVEIVGFAESSPPKTIAIEVWDDGARIAGGANVTPINVSADLSRDALEAMLVDRFAAHDGSDVARTMAREAFSAWIAGRDTTHGIAIVKPRSRTAPLAAFVPSETFAALDSALREGLERALRTAGIEVTAIAAVDLVGSWCGPVARSLRALVFERVVIASERGREFDDAIRRVPPLVRSAKAMLANDIMAVAETARPLRALGQGEPLLLLRSGTPLPATSVLENFKSSSFIESFGVATMLDAEPTIIMPLSIPHYAERQGNSYLRAVVHADTPRFLLVEIAYLYSMQRRFTFFDKRARASIPLADHVFRVVRT